MGDSINNFINLLVRGDFFLIFLIIMMVIIIGVIVYLVRLQIHDTDYYEKDDDEDDDEDYDELFDKEIETIEKPILEEKIEIQKPTVSSMSYDEDDEFEDLEEMDTVSNVSQFESEEEVEEDDHTYDNLERPVPVMIKQEEPVRHVEQSRFDFDNEEVVNSIKDFEDEQEANAIISASELESRINEMKANGEYEAHEKQLQEYEQDQETKAIISYEELLERASVSNISYESEENLDGIRVGKVDTSNIEHYSESNDKPYYKEEAFLEAMKEFRRAL